MSELWNKLKDQFTDHDDDDDMMEEDIPPRPASVNPAGIPAAPRASVAQGIGRAAMPVHQEKPYTVVVVNPNTYKDAEKIGDHLKQACPVVLNLEKTDQEEAVRIVDFINGMMYALDGKIEKISDGIYLCAPSNMSVDKENYAAYSAPAADGGQPLQWKVPQA